MRVPPQKAPPPQLWLQPVLPPPAPPAKAAEAAPAKAVEVAVEVAAGVTEAKAMAAEGVTGAVEELPPPPPPPKCLGFCYWLGEYQLGVTSALVVWWLKIVITLC